MNSLFDMSDFLGIFRCRIMNIGLGSLFSRKSNDISNKKFILAADE